MSWLELILSVYDPFLMSLFLVGFVMVVAIACRLLFSSNLFARGVENDNDNGRSGKRINNFEFNLISFVLLVVVLIGLVYGAYKYFLAKFGVPVIYQEETDFHHSGASGADDYQYSKVPVPQKPQGLSSKNSQSEHNK